MAKATNTLIITLIIGALVGFGAGYYYMQNANTTAFSQGMAYQQSITPTVAPTYTTATELTYTTITDFDHTATVDASGDVAADTTVSHTLTITNNDNQNSGTLWVLFYDPTTSKKGLDSDLVDAIDYITVSINCGSISNIPLLVDGAYVSGGYQLGALPQGSSITITLNVEFLENTHGLFPDAGVENCHLYVYEPGSNNIDAVDFTINT